MSEGIARDISNGSTTDIGGTMQDIACGFREQNNHKRPREKPEGIMGGEKKGRKRGCGLSYKLFIKAATR